MSEYPEDIIKAANEISDEHYVDKHSVVRGIIAAAILAERERCAEGEFQALRGAFLRGVQWSAENGNDAEYAVKAANDYADYNTAIAKVEGGAT